MELYRKLVYFFFLNISTIIADINTVQTTLSSEISPVYVDLFFQDILPKKDVAFRETTDTAHSYIKHSKYLGNQGVYRCLKWSYQKLFQDFSPVQRDRVGR